MSLSRRDIVHRLETTGIVAVIRADSPAQLVNAASAGSRAAIALNHHLLAYDIDHAVTGMAAQKSC